MKKIKVKPKSYVLHRVGPWLFDQLEKYDLILVDASEDKDEDLAIYRYLGDDQFECLCHGRKASRAWFETHPTMYARTIGYHELQLVVKLSKP